MSHHVKFRCPHCERSLTAERKGPSGRVYFKRHLISPRKTEICPGSGRPVDEIPKESPRHG